MPRLAEIARWHGQDARRSRQVAAQQHREREEQRERLRRLRQLARLMQEPYGVGRQ